MIPEEPVSRSGPVLELNDVGVVLGKGTRGRVVLRGVSLALSEGEALGIVGRSGSGKTTLARTAAGLLRPSRGSVTHNGASSCQRRRRFTGESPAAVQMVFQDPFTALNPRVRVGELLLDALERSGGEKSRPTAEMLLEAVGLRSDMLFRYPGRLSGGERQRVCIASALALGSAALVLDEPTTMLDWPSRWQVIQLLRSLRARFGLAVMILSHDLDLLASLCDSVCVIEDGEIIERGVLREVAARPVKKETRLIIEASVAMRKAALAMRPKSMQR